MFEILDDRVHFLPLTEDEERYHQLAKNILRGKGFCLDDRWLTISKAGEPTTTGAFLYPVFLAIIYGLFRYHQLAVWIIQILLNSIIVFPIFLLAKHFFDRRTAVLAAIITSIYPPLVYNSVWMMREAIIVPLLIITFLIVQLIVNNPNKYLYFLAGILIGLSSLTISAFFYFLPFLLTAIVFSTLIKHTFNYKYLGIMIFCMFIIISPWLIRNFITFRTPMLIETKKGVTLWVYNHPGQPINWRFQEHPAELFLLSDTTMNEVQQDRAYFKAAISYICGDKIHFLKISSMRFLLAISPFPKYVPNVLAKLIVTFICGILILCAILGIVISIKNWKEHITIYVAVIYWFIIQAFCAAGMRYRMPIEFTFVLYGSAGIFTIYKRIKKLRSGH